MNCTDIFHPALLNSSRKITYTFSLPFSMNYALKTNTQIHTKNSSTPIFLLYKGCFLTHSFIGHHPHLPFSFFLFFHFFLTYHTLAVVFSALYLVLQSSKELIEILCSSKPIFFCSFHDHVRFSFLFSERTRPLSLVYLTTHTWPYTQHHPHLAFLTVIKKLIGIANQF